MKVLEIKPIGRFLRHYKADYDFFLNGDRNFPVLCGDAVLLHKMRLYLFGIPVAEWMKPIRAVPAFEWARAAFGDNYIPDSSR